jgi:uncharacterized membrane protein
LASLAAELVQLTWWQLILVFVGLLLVVSGPSMVIAWLKLRRRNLAPVLNANGWAVNADAVISVFFGTTLTEQVKYPIVKDPLARRKQHMKPWQAAIVTIVTVMLMALAAYGVYRFMNRSIKSEQPTEQLLTDTIASIEEVVNE